MSTLQAAYSDDERDAMVEAYLDRGIRPARRIVELAEAGELKPGLPAFKVRGREGTIRSLSSEARRRRAGKVRSELAGLPPRDALEALRQRLVSLADHLTHEAERAARRKQLDAKRPTEIARLLREIAAIPGPNDARPVKPGDKIPGGGGKHNGGATTSGPAAAMLAELNKERSHPARGTAHPTTQDAQSQDTESAEPARLHGEQAQRSDARNEQQDDDATHGPDSYLRAEVSSLRSIASAAHPKH